MSRNRKRRRGRGTGRGRDHGFGEDQREGRDDGLPRPPTKTVFGRGRRMKRKVTTEVHDALWSLGSDDRTGRLPKGELCRQAREEVGYLFRLSGAHLRKAGSALAELFRRLF